MVVPLEPGRPSEARQLLRTRTEPEPVNDNGTLYGIN